MKLYQTKVPQIATEIIATLAKEGLLDLRQENRPEAEQDLVAIMEEYLRRDRSLRSNVREHMHRNGLPYSKFGRVRTRLADDWGHPLGEDVERYLARQFVGYGANRRWRNHGCSTPGVANRRPAISSRIHRY